MSTRILGPTYDEMLDPRKIDGDIRKKSLAQKENDPLDPINLFNITWKDEHNRVKHFVLPKALTGVDANIIVMYAKDFPSGSHKVGPTYSVLVEEYVEGRVDPSSHTLVWPSTGNYGVGGAWVSSRMNYDSIVILPEEMSQERFDLIRHYGSKVIATPGCESNVKEIYDKTHELKAQDPQRIRILNQFEAFANYRFHYYVTGNSMIDLVKDENIGNGRVAAVVSTVGSAGTIASGDRTKEEYPECKIVCGEPILCPTLALNGYGAHDIQGIGDKHVTWIHNVMNMDGVVLLDDMDAKTLMRIFASKEGKAFLKTFIDEDTVDFLSDKLGISGCANIIAAIKTAKYYNLKHGDNVLTVATDSLERYHSVMDTMEEADPFSQEKAKSHFERLICYQEPSFFFEGDKYNRLRWHNLKYFTWVEQQGKTVEELNAMRDQSFWKAQRDKIPRMNQLIKALR